jgi:hypothetical protein
MPRKLAIAAGGLALAVALGVPAAAHAAVASPRLGHTAAVAIDGPGHGPGHAAVAPSVLGERARAAAVRPDDFINQGCGQIWDYGIGEYATTNLSTSQIVFKPLSFFATAGSDWLVSYESDGTQAPPEYCNVSITQINGAFEIYDNYTNGCFSADTATGQVREDTPTACLDDIYSWDQWNAKVVGSYHSNTLYQLQNKFVADEGGCLYNYMQSTAIYTTNGCSDTDIFEQFSWTGSNL